MPFDILDTTKINNRNTISYNYYSTPIYLNQFRRTLKNDGYIQIPFVSNKPEPNIMSDIFPLQYNTSNLYITKSHNLIKDVSYNAELILEHDPTTNNDSTHLYTCFLLKTVPVAVNSPIDKIITPTSDVMNFNITMNNMINVQGNKVYYKDKSGNQVVIFTSPISINTIFDISLSEPNKPLFDPVSQNYSILVPPSQNQSAGAVKEGFVEGLTQTAYCQPIDVVDPSMTIEPELRIPLVGKYTPNDATNNVTRTAINFMSFVLVLGLTYIMTPIVYDNYIIALIESVGQAKMNRLRSIDIYTCCVFIFVIITLIIQGIQSNNSNFTLMGFFIGLFFIISMAIIQFKKLDGEWLHKTFESGNNDSNVNYKNIDSSDFMKFLGDNIKIVFHPSNIYVLLLIIGISLFVLYMLGGFKLNKSKNRNKSWVNAYIYISFYIVFFASYVTIVVNSLRTNK